MNTLSEEQLEHIQSLCRQWLSDPSTNRDSRLTIPGGSVLPHAITIEIKSILTFDNVLITSAVDTETAVCYTKLIGKSGEVGTFIDAPLEMIANDEASYVPDIPPKFSSAVEAPERARDEPRSIQTMVFESDSLREKYLLCSNGTVLGYSLLEKTISDSRSGRFFPSDDYFEFAETFAAFPQAENDCFEANVREAYGLIDDDADAYRRVFNELSERIDALHLYVADEAGKPIPTTELRVEDLSQYYRDESERWLHVCFGNPPESVAG